MTIARAIALAALAVAVVLVATLFLGGSDTTAYKIRFQSAGQLVRDDDVQIGGRRVGSITDIKLTSNNEAEVDIELEKGFVPLREGTKAIIRATSLSGIANRYIALTPGNGDKLDPGATLDQSASTSIVDLDQLFAAIDDLGATTVRLSIDWRRFEPVQGQFDWAMYDRVLAEPLAHRPGRRDDVVGGRHRPDDLDELHDRRRVEEVHADDVARSLGGGRALDDR